MQRKSAAMTKAPLERRAICFLLYRWEYGGIQRSLINLAPALRALGFDPFVVVRGPVAPQPAAPGLEIIEIDGYGVAGTALRLTRLLRARRPMVVFAAGSDAVAALAARTLARTPTRIIVRQHNLFDRAVRGRFAWFKRLCYRLLLAHADGFVAVSNGLAGNMARACGIAPSEVTVIHNPVIPEGFSELLQAPADHPFFAEGAPVVFAGIGRLIAQKDFATLVSAFAALRRQRPARLAIIGDGPLRAALQAQVQQLGIGPDVAFLGTRENPFAFMARAAAVVVSSRHEGFCNVVVEALAAGAPVISTDCDFGPGEFLAGGRHGRLVGVGDAGAMTAAMLATLDEKQPNERNRERGLAFTAQASAAHYAALIERVCQEAPVRLPARIKLEASSHCQIKCPSCPTTDGSTLPAIAKGLLRPDAFKRLLGENPWIREVELANYGEIFLNPWLAEILKIGQERGVDLVAATGVNLNHVRPDVLEALVKYKLRAMTCSIDGASPETYPVYRVGGDFQRVIANIQAINAFKKKYHSPYPALTWQFIVFGHNQHEIAAARTMAKSLGMKFRAKLSWDEAFSPLRDPAAVRAELGAASREEYQVKSGQDYGQGICHQLWDSPQVNWDGALLGCCRNFWGDFGLNAFQHGLAKVLRGEKISHARAMLLGKAAPRPDIPCTSCEVYIGMAARKILAAARAIRSRLRLALLVWSLERCHRPAPAPCLGALSPSNRPLGKHQLRR